MKKNAWQFFYALSVSVPLALGLGYALLYSFGLTGLLNSGWTTAHWARVLGDAEIWRSLGFSLYIALASVAISAGIALWLTTAPMPLPRRRFFSLLLYFPLTLPAVVVAFLFFQWLSQAGFFSRLMVLAGLMEDLEDFPELIHDPWGIGIILAHVFMAAPFFTLYMGQLYERERLDAYRSLAYSLGANAWQARVRVLAPVLLHRSWPAMALYAVFVMGAYEVPLLLGSQSPRMATVLVLDKLQKFNLLDIPQAYAVSLLYAVLVLVFTFLLLLRRTKTEGL